MNNAFMEQPPNAVNLDSLPHAPQAKVAMPTTTLAQDDNKDTISTAGATSQQQDDARGSSSYSKAVNDDGHDTQTGPGTTVPVDPRAHLVRQPTEDARSCDVDQAISDAQLATPTNATEPAATTGTMLCLPPGLKRSGDASSGSSVASAKAPKTATDSSPDATRSGNDGLTDQTQPMKGTQPSAFRVGKTARTGDTLAPTLDMIFVLPTFMLLCERGIDELITLYADEAIRAVKRWGPTWRHQPHQSGPQRPK